MKIAKKRWRMLTDAERQYCGRMIWQLVAKGIEPNPGPIKSNERKKYTAIEKQYNAMTQPAK